MTARPNPEGYRYSIIPARAVTDPEITAQALRVLALLGRHTDEYGWCRRSQVKMADELSCSRGTVQNALEILVQHGYVERREETRPGVRPEAGRHPHCSYSYRVKLDIDGHGGANGLARRVPNQEQHGVPTQDQHPVPISLAPLIEPSPLEDSPCEHARAREGTHADQRSEGDATSPPEPILSPDDAFALEWAEFERCPGFDKDAMNREAAWAARRQRVNDLPPTARQIAAIREYGAWLRAENAQRATGGAKPFFMASPRTWYLERRWTKWLNRIDLAAAATTAAEERAAAVTTSLGADIRAKLRRARMRESEINMLTGVTFEPGPPPTFVCPNSFITNLFSGYGPTLCEIWPGVRVVVADAGRRSA